MNVLIIGANGQLGHALQQTLNTREVTAYDIEDVDITSREQTCRALERVKPDVVINAAAYTNVDQAEIDQVAAYRANALGPQHLALATDALGIPLVHISTDYVFDGTHTEPYHEFDRPNPCSVYGKSKLAGEEIIRSVTNRYFIIRTAWLYHTIGNNFPRTICSLAQRSDVRVVNDQLGSPTYAPHLARAIDRIIDTQAYGTYHMAGGGGTSWFGLTQTLFSHLGIAAQVTPVSTKEFPRPAPRPAYAILTTLQDPLILLPPWEQGVKEFAQRYSQEIHVPGT